MQPVQVSSTDLHHQQTIAIREFELLADEPTEFGGDNTGATPTELMLAALGACKTITIQMYAERKGWAVEKVSVNLTHDRVEGRPEIVAHLHLEGNLSDEQRQRLLEIANRCPIHKMLSGSTQIHTSLH